MKKSDKDSVLGEDPLQWMKKPAAGSKSVTAKRSTKTRPASSTGKGVKTADVDEIEDLTIRNVGSLHASLKAKVDSQKSIKLDLHKVRKVDTAGVQLLLALHRECLGRKIALEFIKPSTELLQIIDLLGLCEVMGLEYTGSTSK